VPAKRRPLPEIDGKVEFPNKSPYIDDVPGVAALKRHEIFDPRFYLANRIITNFISRVER
jgi:hypothetical protein